MLQTIIAMSANDSTASVSPGEAGPPPDAFAGEVPQADQQPRPPKKERKVYQQIQLPSPEQIMQEDFMNNCATRTVLSGVMGMGLGVLFGIVMGSMDSAVPPFRLHELSDGHPPPILAHLAAKTASHASVRSCVFTSFSRCLQGVGMTGSMAAGAETQTIRQAATQMLRTVRSRSWCARPLCFIPTPRPDELCWSATHPCDVFRAHSDMQPHQRHLSLAQVLREGLWFHGRRVCRLGVRHREVARAA